MASRRLKFWGWGYEGEGPGPDAAQGIARALAARFGVEELTVESAPRIEEIELRAPRVRPPAGLSAFLSDEPHERARHCYGAAYRDVVRAFRREFRNPPDWVAFPRDEGELVQVLDWCGSEDLAAIPFGGGSSVVGGVECPAEDAYRGAVSIDLTRLDRVLEIDRSSRAARIQGGALGPVLEVQLRPHGLTLRHFPQSFEFSTLGGWIATRSGGHFATRYTHIDDFVESLRVITPSGPIETRRLPGSGAGPSPDRLFIGSEGILGIISEAWMRLQDRPSHRLGASVAFPSFEQAVQATRALSQSGLEPANCRLLDPLEAESQAGASGKEAILLVAFESADHPVDAWLARALELCRDHGGRTSERAPGEGREGHAGAWRSAFLAAPYLRDVLISIGVLSDTFETAVTWDRFEALHQGVMSAVGDALRRVCGGGTLTCRFTHVYPDGPAPYFTMLAPARRGGELEQWAELKRVASDAVLELGGTITHHHAVGRDHRLWYDRQRPAAFARALAAVKRTLDPTGILNPGVLVDPLSG
ncbi:MAG: FAD-binding oxidoreductase [Myxococcota bacterium]